MSETKLYLLDVEGTVAPLTLTTDVLFPYARKYFEAFLSANVHDPAVREDLVLLTKENQAEGDPSSPKILGAPGPALGTWESTKTDHVVGGALDYLLSPGAPGLASETGECTTPDEALRGALTYLLWLMDHDRKSTALKSLQGKIWKEGFEAGELVGTVFDDVPPAFARWAAHAKVAIYSSGSVEAQKLFFRHSSAGDLTPLISGYFDTRTGPKTESASYPAIAAYFEIEPCDCLFFSDAVRELDAARYAGFGTRLVVRPGNPRVENLNGHLRIDSFEFL